jgi:hypothetical protein
MIHNTTYSLVIPPAEADYVLVETVSNSSKGIAVTHALMYKILLKELREKVVLFTYRKKDGSYRNAVGTVCEDLIPKERLSKIVPTGAVDGIKQNYFDFGSKEFRAFDTSSVVAIIIPQ